jgi:thiol:disulfide interchange protein
MKKKIFLSLVLLINTFINGVFFIKNDPEKKQEVHFSIPPEYLVDADSIVIASAKEEGVFQNKMKYTFTIHGGKAIYIDGKSETFAQKKTILQHEGYCLVNEPIFFPIKVSFALISKEHNTNEIKSEYILGDERQLREEENERKEALLKDIENKTRIVPQAQSFLTEVVEYAKDKNALLIALIAFLLGLLMSFTPCIYPMIPITISILGIEKKPFRERFQKALLYVLGMSTTFSLLGLLAASGKLFFGQFFSMPIFTIIFSFILLFMTLNMFGMIPSFFSFNLMNSMPESLRTHPLLPFFYGLFSGTITSPCVSPGLVAMLSLVAHQKSNIIGWLWLFSFGLGLSFLLFLLSLLLNTNFVFPKTGPWMITVKESIGVLLAFILWGNLARFLSYTSSSLLIAAVLLLFIFYKYIRFEALVGEKKYWFSSYSVLLAFLFLSFVIIDWKKKYSHTPLEEVIHTSVKWYGSIEKARSDAISEKKLVLLDFTARWCSSCTLLDKKVFQDVAFIEEVKPYCLLVKVDCSAYTDEIKKLMQKYSVQGLPTILVINPRSDHVLGFYHDDLTSKGVQKEFFALLHRYSSVKESVTDEK